MTLIRSTKKPKKHPEEFLESEGEKNFPLAADLAAAVLEDAIKKIQGSTNVDRLKTLATLIRSRQTDVSMIDLLVTVFMLGKARKPSFWKRRKA